MSFSFKFLPLKDLFYSVFPTVGTYGGYLQGVAPTLFPNKWMALGIGLVMSVLLAVLFYRENVKAYKRSLAEILATGYFINFTGRFGKLLKTKTPIHFSFPDNSVETFTADKIRVEVGLPENLSALTRYADQVEQDYDIVYVREATYSEPFWVRARTESDHLIIAEFPRTLFSLSKYLQADFMNQANAEVNSRKIYGFFHEKIEQLRIEHANELPGERLVFAAV